jgi:hypothetical protein
MLDILRKENPSIVEAMIQEGQMKTKEDDNDEKAMQEDLENDNSLESKIEKEVKRIVSKLSEKMEHKIDGLQDDTLGLVRRLNKASEDQMHSRADETQMYIKEVHSFQIDEMKSFKGCHLQYLNSSAQLDNKLSTVIGIE